MKRSDITQIMVLEHYALPIDERYPADEKLMAATGAPLKVVWSAMQRESDLGLLDYGVNLRGGWLTPEGHARLEELREVKP